MLLVERRLNDTIDRLVTECVVAYFDRATSELTQQAHHDQLTGLLNHQAFVRELEAEIERAGRYGHGVALVFFDLDNFKEVNDTLGHQAGDRALKALRGSAARDCCAPPTARGRMGGDEFAAYLVEADDQAGKTLDRRGLRATTRELGACPISRSARARRTTPTRRSTRRSSSALADERLYSAKRASAA